jgi:nucleoside-diphosphate-sugar epimerase
MHVFVTGATGWVGSAVVEELLSNGHKVTGLVRSPEKASDLVAKGAAAVNGSLDDLEILRRAASSADAVIHTAFNHDFMGGDFSKFLDSSAQDQRVIDTLGSALEGSDRPIIVTSGLLGLPRGAKEFDIPSPGPRKSEPAARALAERCVRASTIRLAPSVHGLGDKGFIRVLANLARETRVSAFVGNGQNCWSGVHRSDAARLYRLAIESSTTERVHHAVADEAVPFKAIAEVIGRRLGLPTEPREPEHFGWLAKFASSDMAGSSAQTRESLGWKPTGPSLIGDLERPEYYA